MSEIPVGRTDAAEVHAAALAGSVPRRSVASRLSDGGIVYALLLLVLLLTLYSMALGQPLFVRPANIANILQQAAPFAILAVFETVVLISGNFDISIGSVAALGALLVVMLAGGLGVPLAILVALTVGGMIGLTNGLLVQKVGVNSFIVTLGMLTAIRGLVIVMTGGRSVGAGPAADSLASLYYRVIVTPNLFLVGGLAVAIMLAIRVIGQRRAGAAWSWDARSLLLIVAAVAGLGLSVVVDYRLPLLQPVWLMLAIAFATWWFMRSTVMGRRIYAVGGNAEAASLAGINVDRYRIGAFVALGVAAGLTGALFATQLGSMNPTGLQGTEFTVLTAAILGGTGLFGGTGNALKSLVGTLFLFTLINGFNTLNLGANFQSLVEGTVIIIAAALYSAAGRKAAR